MNPRTARPRARLTPAILAAALASVTACATSPTPPTTPGDPPPVTGAQHPITDARWISSQNTGDPIKAMTTGLVETGTTAADGQIYVIGGLAYDDATGGFTRTNRAFRYDPAAQQWFDIPAYPGPAIDHPGVVTLNRTIYVIGGTKAYPNDAVTYVQAYDIDTKSWSSRAGLPQPRGAGVAAVHDGKIYYAGGIQNGVAYADTFVYDPATNEWARLAAMPHARDHAVGEFVNGELYVIGGRGGFQNNSQTEVMNYNEAYDPATNTWTTRKPMPTARSAMSSGVLEDKIVVFGGEKLGAEVFKDTEAYDPRTDAWTTLSPMLTPRHGTQGATLNGTIYVPGGGPDWGTPDPNAASPDGQPWGALWGDRSQWKADITTNEAFGFQP